MQNKEPLNQLSPMDIARYGVVAVLAVKRIRSEKGSRHSPEHLSHTDIVRDLKPQNIFASVITVDDKHGRVSNPFRSQKAIIERALVRLEEEGLIAKQEDHAGQHRFYTLTDEGKAFYHDHVIGSHHILRPEKDPLVSLHEVKAALGQVLGQDNRKIQAILNHLAGNEHARERG